MVYSEDRGKYRFISMCTDVVYSGKRGKSIFIKVSRFQKFPQNSSRPLDGPEGPTDGAEGCSPPQKLENVREAGHFSSIE